LVQIAELALALARLSLVNGDAASGAMSAGARPVLDTPG
jgi:hypothetical protein